MKIELKEMTKLSYISLFSSAGVGRYGFSLEGFDCVATNELIERRLEVQKFNNKCSSETGYILGDITQDETKNKILSETKKWLKEKLEEKLIDSECIFHKRKKSNIANHINSTYSHMLDIVCKGCDGYNLSCKDYSPYKKN